MDQNIKQQIVETLNGTTNVLVTVSSNPSVDELAACIGLTLVLNKLDKHATAVFSGKAPSTLEFLKPEETLEKNTDSLRDFIISLDKTKADKLRYKVEDSVVKIFITPYKTSISQKDFEFSQGDFNVDVVLALGVHKREELDQAIVAHGRILHDATVICVNNEQVSNLGVYNWQDAEASSLCEMVVDLAETIKPDNFDAQMATALLTGIVAETERFSNEKTSPRTMSLSAKLMAAGANQQLVASKLQTQLKQEDVASANDEPETDKVDGDTLTIAHNPDEDDKGEEKKDKTELEVDHKDEEEPFTEESIDKPERPDHEKRVEPDVSDVEASNDESEDANRPKITGVKSEPTESRSALPDAPKPSSDVKPTNSRLTYEPPTMGGTLTANARPEGLEPTTDAMSLPTPVGAQMLSHDTPKTDVASTDKPLMDEETLSHIEKSVGSDHADQSADAAPAPDIDALQQAVEAAVNADDNKDRLEPLAASGSSPLDMNVQSAPPVADALTPMNPGPPPLDTPTVVPPAPAAPASVPTPDPLVASSSDSGLSSVPTAAPAPAPGPSASELMASLTQSPPQNQGMPPTTPFSPAPTPVASPASPSLPQNLVPPDPGLPPEQTASGTPNPLAPPPVPPPFTGGFPPATPPAPGGQPPLPPVPPAPGA